jgi:hypothetical protein
MMKFSSLCEHSPLNSSIFQVDERTFHMELSIQLEKMTVIEKIAAIETIWRDLTRTDESVPSHSWHRDVLEARRSRVEESVSEFTEWSEARDRIRQQSQ